MKKNKKNNIRIKKHLGQNFLINKKIIEKITNTIDDLCDYVIEIGPGTGALTDLLVKKTKKLIIIEIDYELNKHLEKKYCNFKNIVIINQNFLNIGINELVNKEFNNQKFSIISNLPYYLTSPIIFKIFNANLTNINQMVLMIQKEVAERIISLPNNKKYNNLSVTCQYYCDISKICDVSRNNFFPIPEVDSIVLNFVFNKKIELEKKDEKEFLFMIKKLFSHKRKNLINNLTLYTNDSKINTKIILEDININPNIRAENLNLEQFYKLWKALNPSAN